MAISLIINGREASLKKGSSIEYVSENRIFTDADDYSMEIELPLADCPQNINIFGNITRKDIETEQIFFDAILQDTHFRKRGAVVITGITQECVKVQFLEKRSYQNFYPTFDETYIDELDLGEWPHIFPDNISSGGMSGARPGWEDATYMTPAQMWARWQDYTALPWVNNYSGNLQNCARWNSNQNKYEWKVNPDDNDDTDYTKGFSFQPNLLWLTKKICDALGYGYDFAKWENSDYKYLLVCNTVPYAWSSRKWASALPHWTINEFFMELEKLMLCEFDIDHGTHVITCSMSSENQVGAGAVLIDKVVDAFSVEVSNENKTEYKAMLNQGYAAGGHRLDNIYNAQWYIDKLTGADGTVKCTEWATLSDLFNSNLKQDSVSDTGGGRSDYATYAGGKWGLHHVQDIDTYFVLEVMKRVEYKTTPFTINSEHLKWGNVCRLVPVNRFGTLILDRENKEEVDEMNIVPAWIDETDEEYGNVIFLECGESGEDDATNSAHQTHSYVPDGVTWQEHVEPDVPIQFGAFSSVSDGEKEKSGAVFDKLFVAFWWGDYLRNKPQLPHPWTDTFDMTYGYQEPPYLTDTSKLTIIWGVIYSGKQLSLRINNLAYGQSNQRATYIEVDQKRKYSFSFLSDEIPNVRSVFYIEGQRYLCEKITVTFSEDGMSSLQKGEFYRVV
ncbi:MAG: hypothetical protein J6N71_05720 [Muribaculaceae bacterium]|nr:hypothetical protein [Muribaculaceae bacterium]